MGKDHLKLLNNLQQLRKAAHLTQQELSEAAEVSRKSINAISKTYVSYYPKITKSGFTFTYHNEDILFVLENNTITDSKGGKYTRI